MTKLSFLTEKLSEVFEKPVKQDDPWTGYDKKLHLIAGAAVGGAVTYVSKDAVIGTWMTCLVAFLKESYDAYHPNHTASLQDFLVTVLSGFIGASLSILVIA